MRPNMKEAKGATVGMAIAVPQVTQSYTPFW
jgi:hypothetical protein